VTTVAAARCTVGITEANFMASLPMCLPYIICRETRDADARYDVVMVQPIAL